MQIQDYFRTLDRIGDAGFGAIHKALYTGICSLANDGFWAEETVASSPVLPDKAGIKDTRTLWAAMDDLAALDLLKYNKGVGRRATSIWLNPHKNVGVGKKPTPTKSQLLPPHNSNSNPYKNVPVEQNTLYKNNKTIKTNKTVGAAAPSHTVEFKPDADKAPMQEYKIPFPEGGKIETIRLEAEGQEEKKKVARKKKSDTPPHPYAESPYYGPAALAAAFADKPWAATCNWQKLHTAMDEWLDRKSGQPPSRHNWKAVANQFLQHQPDLKTDANPNRPSAQQAGPADYRSRKERAASQGAHRLV